MLHAICMLLAAACRCRCCCCCQQVLGTLGTRARHQHGINTASTRHHPPAASTSTSTKEAPTRNRLLAAADAGRSSGCSGRPCHQAPARDRSAATSAARNCDSLASCPNVPCLPDAVSQGRHCMYTALGAPCSVLRAPCSVLPWHRGTHVHRHLHGGWMHDRAGGRRA